MLAPVLVTGPTETPVSLSEAKAHLNVEFSQDDALITAMIEAATAHLDGPNGILGRALVTQEWRQDFDEWPDDEDDLMRLPLGPATEIESVKYFDASNVEQTLSSAKYALLSDHTGPYVSFAWDFNPPAIYWRDDAVRVTFTAGYGAASDVPGAIKAAILLIVGDLYKNRDSGEPKPNAAVDMLLTPYRRVWVG